MTQSRLIEAKGMAQYRSSPPPVQVERRVRVRDRGGDTMSKVTSFDENWGQNVGFQHLESCGSVMIYRISLK